MGNGIILSIKDLQIHFILRGITYKVIRDLSLDVYKNEILAIVGESGSGKSVLCKALIGMLDQNASIKHGSAVFSSNHSEVDLMKIRSEIEWQKVRGKKIGMIMQDPMNSLNPLRPVGQQITEAILLHRKIARSAAKSMALEYLSDVGIADPQRCYTQYPHELSGGTRQRIVIAITLACGPELLICDEPTTAIDVTLQIQILELMRTLQRRYHFTILFITHDLGVVAHIADRVVVMYAGQMLETGTVEEIFNEPKHPYTIALLESLPQLAKKGIELFAISGSPPDYSRPIIGDPFAPRNPNAMKIDFLKDPPKFSVSKTHTAYTWLLDPRASNYKQTLNTETRTDELHKLCDSRTIDTRHSILEIRNLTVSFGKKAEQFQAVQNVSLSVMRGETFGIVGESGSGKTTIARTVMRLCAPTQGEIFFDGNIISGKISRKEDIVLTHSLQMIFQDPFSSVNGRSSIGNIIAEGILNQRGVTYRDALERVKTALIDVGLSPTYIDRFPHEFSGGQLQRIGIARAIIMNPKFIIADEPVSSLDVSVRAHILNLLNRLKYEKNLSYLLISHDLSVMRYICDHIATMYRGKILELADTETLFSRPLHPYTKALISATPIPDPAIERNRTPTFYDPSIHHYGSSLPTLREIEKGHFVLCDDREENQYFHDLGLV